jgi:hypothetical protein
VTVAKTFFSILCALVVCQAYDFILQPLHDVMYVENREELALLTGGAVKFILIVCCLPYVSS